MLKTKDNDSKPEKLQKINRVVNNEFGEANNSTIQLNQLKVTKKAKAQAKGQKSWRSAIQNHQHEGQTQAASTSFDHDRSAGGQDMNSYQYMQGQESDRYDINSIQNLQNKITVTDQ